MPQPLAPPDRTGNAANAEQDSLVDTDEAAGDAVRLLDRLCDAFEAAWLAGETPSLDEYLLRCPEPARERLLRELVALEVAYRRDRGEAPQPVEYLVRYADADAVGAAFETATRRADTVRQKTRAFAPDLPAGTRLNERYEVAEVLGRGGMGVVYRARDVVLRRPLAIKVMRSDDVPLQESNPSDAERRFWEEARITGQLQHPGVPPVHEVGRLSDGRPFIAMKLIEGRTLGRMLSERGSPRHDLPRFLKIFEQVAQTLAYSHAQGVIHRDLKPANVMVGPFGEVQVMDWGLAKRLRGDDGELRRTEVSRPRAEAASLDVIPPSADSSVSLHGDSTRTRTFLPDDAQHVAPGRLTRVGLIMGTLAYMPPEQARGEIDSLDERSDVFGLGAILLAILTGEPPYAEREGRAALAIAARADLAAAWQRLDACGADGELASLVRSCLAASAQERPADAGAVARRVADYLDSLQRRLKAAEIEHAADQARIAEERKRRRVTIALAACAVLLVAGGAFVIVRGYQQRLETNARQERIERDLEIILADSAAELTSVQDQLADPLEYRTLLDQPLRWEAALGSVEAGVKRAEGLLEAAVEALDDSLPARLAELRSSLSAAQQEREFVERLEIIRLEDSIRVKDKWTLASVLPKYEAAFREAGFDVEHGDAQALAARMRASSIRWPLVAALDHWAAVAREKGRESVDRLLRLARETDPHPFRNRFRDLAVWSDPQALARLADDPQALEQSPQFIEALAWVHSNNFGDAKPLLRAAIAQYPRDYWLLFRMGLIAPDPIEQAGYFRAAIVIRPESGYAYNNLGNALLADGLFEEGVFCYQRAHELEPENADMVYNLGRAMSEMERYPEALDWYKQSAELDPDPMFVAMVHTAIGLNLREQDQLEEAVASYQVALSLNPKYALAHNNLGLVYKAQNKLEEAKRCYEKALENDPKLAMAHTNLGKLLHEQGRRNEALACYRKALELDPKYSDAHLSLGVALKDQDLLHEAVAAYRKALELTPRNALAHRNLGYVLFKQQQLDDAEYHFRRAAELDPRDVDAVHNLGSALKEQGKLDEAMIWYRKALELDPKYESAYLNLGNALRKLGRLPEAAECFEKVLEFKPHDAEAHHHLGATIYELGKRAEAIALYRKALELKPDYAKVYYNLGVAMHDQGQQEQAIEAYRKSIELDATDADAHRNLGLLLYKQLGRFAEALPLLERAQELGAKDPDWPDPDGQAIRNCRRFLRADALLTAVDAGEKGPAAATDYRDLAELCVLHKRRHAAAVRFYRQAFAADAALGDEIAAARYNAACAATMAGTGQGLDAPPLAEGETDNVARAELRGQALDWLRAEITDYRRVLNKDLPDPQGMTPVMIGHLPRDETLAAVRESACLAALPAEEQDAWRDFWRQVEELNAMR